MLYIHYERALELRRMNKSASIATHWVLRHVSYSQSLSQAESDAEARLSAARWQEESFAEGFAGA